MPARTRLHGLVPEPLPLLRPDPFRNRPVATPTALLDVSLPLPA